MAVGFDQERCHSSCHCSLGHERRIIGAKPFGFGCAEFLDETGEAREVARLDDAPSAFAQGIDRQRLRIQLDAFC